MPKASRGTLDSFSFSHTYIYPIQQQILLPLSFKICPDCNHFFYPYPLSPGVKHILSGLLQRVLLTVSLIPPLSLLKTNLNIKLKTILLKYKCAVKLALPKKRSDHCLGFLEVIWFITDRSDRRGWSHQTFRQDWPYPRVLAMPERPISVEASGHTESIDL